MKKKERKIRSGQTKCTRQLEISKYLDPALTVTEQQHVSPFLMMHNNNKKCFLVKTWRNQTIGRNNWLPQKCKKKYLKTFSLSINAIWLVCAMIFGCEMIISIREKIQGQSVERSAIAAAATGILAGFVPQVVIDKLAKTKSGGEMAGSGVVGRRSGTERRIGRVVDAVAIVYAPIEPVAKEFLGPALSVAEQKPLGNFLSYCHTITQMTSSSSSGPLSHAASPPQK